MSYLYDKLNSLQWEVNQKVEALQWEVNQKVEAIIDEMTEVLPQDVYLDKRSAYRLYIDKEYIAVQKGSDLKTLRYYGGFEYVNEEHVQEFGDYVFYHAEDERVADHLAQYYQDQEDEENV